MVNAPQVMRSVRGGNHGVSAMDTLVLYCVLDSLCVCVCVCVCVCMCVCVCVFTSVNANAL